MALSRLQWSIRKMERMGNWINGVMGMLEIIRRNMDDRERVEECLGKIQLSTSHLLALVNDVLDMGRIEAKQQTGMMEAFDLEHPDAGTVTILAMTAQSSADSIHQCEQAGMNGYIAKPVETAELLRILAENVPKGYKR